MEINIDYEQINLRFSNVLANVINEEEVKALREEMDEVEFIQK